MMTLWHKNLQRLIPIVEEKLVAADAVTGEMAGDYHGWNNRLRSAEAALVEHFTRHEDAKFGETGDAHTVRMAGIKASSTMGIRVALRNWRTSAQMKIEMELNDPEVNCPGHASAPGDDPMICMHCGVHVRELQPDDGYDDVINLQGSGPVPIEPKDVR